MKLASALVVALGLAASAADAFKVTVYTSATDCTGSKSVAYGSGDSCSGDDGSSGKVTCASVASTSSWTFETWNSNEDCTGAADSTVTGTDSTTCSVYSGALSVMVDCGASACFSGEATVTLEGGARVPMSQLNPGDRVLSSDEMGNLYFDKVFRVTHWEDAATAQFVRVTTDDGKTLELTDSHYMHVAGLDASSLKPARDVTVGDVVLSVDADGSGVSPSSITKVEAVKGRGLYNVHTLSGRVVVNGIVASHFSEDTTWSGDSKLSVAPYWYKAVDFVSSIFGNPQNARNE